MAPSPNSKWNYQEKANFAESQNFCMPVGNNPTRFL